MLAKVKDLIARKAKPIRKTLVALVTPFVVLAVAKVGLGNDPDLVSTVATTLVTTLLVYLVPNSKPVLEDEVA